MPDDSVDELLVRISADASDFKADLEDAADAAEKNANRTANAFSNLRGSLRQGQRLGKGMEQAFDALTGKGEVSISMFRNLATAIPLMSNPIGLAVGGIAGLIGIFAKLKTAMDALDMETWAGRFENLRAEQDATTEGWNKYLEALGQGKTKEEADAARVYGQALGELASRSKDADDQIKKLQERNQAILKETLGMKDGLSAEADEMDRTGTRTGELHEKYRNLNSEFEGNKRAIDALKGSLIVYENNVATTKKAVDDLTKAQKDQKKAEQAPDEAAIAAEEIEWRQLSDAIRNNSAARKQNVADQRAATDALFAQVDAIDAIIAADKKKQAAEDLAAQAKQAQMATTAFESLGNAMLDVATGSGTMAERSKAAMRSLAMEAARMAIHQIAVSAFSAGAKQAEADAGTLPGPAGVALAAADAAMMIAMVLAFQGKIGGMHEGGIVGGPPGRDQVPMMLERGEQVIPRDQVGKGGHTFITNVSFNSYTPHDKTKAKDWVDKELIPMIKDRIR